VNPPAHNDNTNCLCWSARNTYRCQPSK